MINCPTCGKPYDRPRIQMSPEHGAVLVPWHSEPVVLSRQLYRLCELLVRAMPRLVSLDTIAGEGWPDCEDPKPSKYIHVMVHYLRKEIQPAGLRIVSVRDLGYRLEISHFEARAA